MHNFLFQQIIGTGSTSTVYKVQRISDKTVFALKYYKETDFKQLKQYRILQSLQSLKGFPKIFDLNSTQQRTDSKILLMERLGISLKQFFHLRNQKLSIKTIINISKQMLCRLKTLHSLGYIHCDVKPQNFVFGIMENRKTIFLIDFGMSQPISSLQTHIDKSRGFSGNLLYSSLDLMTVNTIPTYLHDLESMVFMIIQLVTGRLPWKGLQQKSMEKLFFRIRDLKNDSPIFDNNNESRNRWCNQLLAIVRDIGVQSQKVYDSLKTHLQNLESL